MHPTVLMTMAKHANALIGPAVLLIYPLYASMRAIESPSPVDDQQWLTYWVLYSLITLSELSFWRVLQWFPLWPYMKLVFDFWLVLPAFNGAAYIYEKYVRSYVKQYVDWNYPEKQRRLMQLQKLFFQFLLLTWMCIVAAFFSNMSVDSFNDI
ncbi:HVA22-like protein f [Zingiber officinale]|uniref:HVA22-like protein f n=1 Tax=Zingiber officinale TaxID=94328 RepID=UPI001C4D79D4|nr:HVA22-like protein f [Zingiber officinale]